MYVNPSDKNISTIRKYVIAIDMIRGRGVAGIRECKAGERTGDEKSCLLSNISQMKDKSISEDFHKISVSIKKINNFYQIIFEYDMSKCRSFSSNKSNQTVYYCIFHLLGANRDKARMDYTLMISDRVYAAMLKEGQIHKETIY